MKDQESEVEESEEDEELEKHFVIQAFQRNSSARPSTTKITQFLIL